MTRLNAHVRDPDTRDFRLGQILARAESAQQIDDLQRRIAELEDELTKAKALIARRCPWWARFL